MIETKIIKPLSSDTANLAGLEEVIVFTKLKPEYFLKNGTIANSPAIYD